MSIQEGNNNALVLYSSFVCCLCRTRNFKSFFFFSLPVYGCDCLWASVCAFERMSRQEREEIDEGGKQEQCSTGAGRVVGWKMPEGFIRLEGRGREQFCWKSIRPKHKYRRAPNPDLTLQSLLQGFSIFLFFSRFLTHTHPSSPTPSLSNSQTQLAPAPVPARAHLYSMLPLDSSFSFTFFLLFLDLLSGVLCCRRVCQWSRAVINHW